MPKTSRLIRAADRVVIWAKVHGPVDELWSIFQELEDAMNAELAGLDMGEDPYEASHRELLARQASGDSSPD